MIYAACGPPHSGKSVLLRALYRLGGFYIVPVQPDGEGFGWTTFGDPETVSTIRRKGNFDDPDVWDTYARHAENLRKNVHYLNEIALLDMGGKPTKDKIKILEKAKAAVMLVIREDQFDTAKLQWEEIAKKAGVPIRAILRTTLQGQSIIYREKPIFEAKIAGLLRGEEKRVANDQVVKSLANFLKNITDKPKAVQKRLNPSELILDIQWIEAALGIPRDSEHLQGRAWWRPEHLGRLFELVTRVAKEHTGKSFVISGPAPVFVIITILYALQNIDAIYLEDPKVEGGRVKITEVPLDKHPIGPFQLMNNSKYQVLYLNPRAEVLKIKDISKWKIPEIEGKPIVLWGRAPLWLYAITAKSISKLVPWLGVAQPHLNNGKPGFTITISNVDEIKLGGTYQFSPPMI